MSKAQNSSTQEHLPIAGIQDDIIIMNDGSVRAVLKIEPINFELKSDTEQNGIIFSYQGFLNSLDFPVQIIIQSKKLDLEPYLMKLSNLKKDISNDLLRIQAEDYIDFVRRLISVANIMSKKFYVAVSYSAVTKNTTGASFNSMFHRKAQGPLLDEVQFKQFHTQVLNRANLVGGGLGRLGLRVSLLETQKLIELFYGIYNPDIATEERLIEMDSLSGNIVSSPELLATSNIIDDITPEPVKLPGKLQKTDESPIQDIVPIEHNSLESQLAEPAKPAVSPIETTPLVVNQVQPPTQNPTPTAQPNQNPLP